MSLIGNHKLVKHLLLASILTGCVIQADFAPNADKLTNLTSLDFDKREIYVNTTDQVYHMEIDLCFDDGSHILFAERTSLKTTNQSQTSLIISGFRGVTCFKQLNTSHIVVADRTSGFIKMVDRDESSIRNMAGRPGLQPYWLELDKRNPGRMLYISNSEFELGSIDIESGEMKILISQGLRYPRGMAWYNDHLLIISHNFISEVTWNDDNSITNTLLFGSTTSYGHVNGNFSVAKINYARVIRQVSQDLFLITEGGNNRLRLLDMKRRLVLPVCISAPSCTMGTYTAYNRGILKTDDEVYLSSLKMIFRLSGGTLFTNASRNMEPSSSGKQGKLRGRRMFFEAHYNVACDEALKNVDRDIILVAAKKHSAQIDELCGKYCRPVQEPAISCQANILKIQWPTDLIYPAKVTSINPYLKRVLLRNISAIVPSNLGIVLLSKIPPLVYPVKNSDGLIASVTLVPVV